MEKVIANVDITQEGVTPILYFR